MSKCMNGRGLLAATALVLLTSGLAAPAWARTNHAVLVAVNAYPNLPPRLSLDGPNNDAKLVRDYLIRGAPVKFEPSNVAVLASGLDEAALPPTRENILAALKSVADKAVRDDFVYLHFSGHGAQQPARTADTETDGMDEIFLPSDSFGWDKEKRVPNALLDDEVGAALDAIRARGAFVWVVFDACNSGSATRAVDVAEETDRKVDFDDLGIPAAEIAAARARATGAAVEREAAFDLSGYAAADGASRAAGLDPENQDGSGADAMAPGGMVAFFAAQTIETTPEIPLPKGVEGAGTFGLFTYTLFSKLAQNHRMTYRQLGHAVLQQYSADSRQKPTPLFEGELDAPVFGTVGGDVLMQWPVEVKDDVASIPAGLLHRLSEGTRLAVLPSPDARLDQAIGYLEVRSPENLTSTVVPVAFNGKPALKLDQLPPNAPAQLAELTVDYRLRVARPAAGAGLAGAVKLVDSVLDELSKAEDRRFNVELVGPGDQADLRLAVLRENEIDGAAKSAGSAPALWFLPPSGKLSLSGDEKPPLVAIDPANREKLAKGTRDNLIKIFRASSLSRLAAAGGGQPDGVSVEFAIKRKGKDGLEPLAEATVPIVNPDDQVHVVAVNKSGKLMDINILYVGSDYAVGRIVAERLADGATLRKGLLKFTEKSFGMERMIAVITEASPQHPKQDLKFLEQDGVPPVTRSAPSGRPGLADMLADIGLAPATRSAVTLDDEGGSKGAVMLFPFQTAPRP